MSHNNIITTPENPQAVTAVAGAPLTTTLAAEASPSLLRNTIDERIVKIRPMATPLDQLSRCGGARRCSSMQVEYYSVASKPVTFKLKKDITLAGIQTDSDGLHRCNFSTGVDEYLEISETIIFPGLPGTADTGPLTAYIAAKSIEFGITVVFLNLDTATTRIPANTMLVRMGRAATELDVQTAQFEALPKKASNLCQIFKMQVEQSTFMKIAGKEIDWTFSDQEEVAIMDMRLGMEKNFLFGHKATITDPVKKEPVTLTGGIWYQTEKEFSYTTTGLNTAAVIEMCRQAFTGNSGSNRKILLAGTGLVEKLSNLEYTRTLSAGETKTKWGLEFSEIRSNFGSLYLIHSEIFDQCGHSDDGMIIDPEYITKYCHVPFQTEKLDLRRSGLRNTDAIVITEASCLVLRYPDSHMKITCSD